jgi:hypothetical protein
MCWIGPSVREVHIEINVQASSTGTFSNLDIVVQIVRAGGFDP